MVAATRSKVREAVRASTDGPLRHLRACAGSLRASAARHNPPMFHRLGLWAAICPAAARRAPLSPAAARWARALSQGPPSGQEAVAFRVSAADAYVKWHAWHLGLSPLTATSRELKRVHLPFWHFTARAAHAGAPHLEAFVYAGEAVPRHIAGAVLLAPVEEARPYWGPSESLDGTAAEPYALFEKGAWALAQAAAGAPAGARYADIASRRVLLPAYLVTYRVLGFITLKAYINGYSGTVWGEAQETPGARLYALYAARAQSYTAETGFQSLGKLGAVLRLLARDTPQLAQVLGLLATLAMRVLLSPPVLVSLGAFVGHTLLSPFLSRRASEARWEALRREERARQEGQRDEWLFREAEQRVRERQQRREAQGSQRSSRQWEQGGWEQWEQQRGGGGSSSSSSSGGSGGAWGGGSARGAAKPAGSSSRTSSGSSSRGKMPPFVAPGDHHAVLGLSGSFSQEELSAAFRRELQTYHPDHSAANGWDPQAASDRTRDILEAYRALKRGR